MTPRHARAALALLAIAGSLMTAASAHAAGELAQKPGPAGCISDDGTGGACRDGRVLYGPGTSRSARTAATPPWRGRTAWPCSRA